MAQAMSQMMTVKVVFPESGPTGLLNLRRSAIRLLDSARMTSEPRLAQPMPAARIADQAAPFGVIVAESTAAMSREVAGGIVSERLRLVMVSSSRSGFIVG